MFYCPEVGRFLSRDLVPRPVANLYTYCENDPISLIDPSGLESLSFGDGAKSPVSAKVQLSEKCHGTLTITWKNRYGQGLMAKSISGATVDFKFVEDSDSQCCKCSIEEPNKGPQFRGYQTIQSSSDWAGMSAAEKDSAIAEETKEHGNNDPFGGTPVGDNPTGDANLPYGKPKLYPDINSFAPNVDNSTPPKPKGGFTVHISDSPFLPASRWPVPGTKVTKSFVTQLYCDKTNLGLTIEWSTTQYSQQPEKTTLTGIAKW